MHFIQQEKYLCTILQKKGGVNQIICCKWEKKQVFFNFYRGLTWAIADGTLIKKRDNNNICNILWTRNN